ncbi:MAG: 3'(2'),5'-bisphosphate nucleotidase [Planctomycetota bacterium]
MSVSPEVRERAIDAVRLAGELCRAVQAELTDSDALDKQDRSPVTVADFGAQAIVAHALSQGDSDFGMVAEEASAVLRQPDQETLRSKVIARVRERLGELSEEDVLGAIDRGRCEGGTGSFWTLDPIDGTKGFLRGDQYAIALARVENGQVVFGVLGCPNLLHDAADPDGRRGCLFIAAQGEGAKWQSQDGKASGPIRVADIEDPAAAAFCESVESAHSAHGDSAKVAEILGVQAEPFRIDSQCKYAAVARGDAAIYLRLPTRKDYREKIWDHAAGWIVITEAGGRVTDVAGQDLDFSKGRALEDNRGIIATNGRFHDRVVAAVQSVIGG